MYRLATITAMILIASRADAAPEATQADLLFRLGRDQMALGKLAEACAAFEESQQLDPAPTTLMNLAGCRERRGELATAWSLFVEAEHATRGATDATGQQLHTVAQNLAAKLEPRVPRLTISVPADHRFQGLSITRGDAPVDPALWNQPTPLDGGTYKITASGAGATPWSTTIVIGRENDAKTVHIPYLHPLAAVLAPAPVSPTLPDAPPPLPVEHHPSYAAPIVISIAALGLGGGAVALHLNGNNYEAAAKAAQTQPVRDNYYAHANTRRDAAQAAAAAGAVTAGVAIWLWIRAGHTKTREAETAIRFAPSRNGVMAFGAF